MRSKEENLTENHTIPIISEICTKKSVNEENTSLFMNSSQKGKKEDRNLKSEKSQDYAQKPRRNCMFMNSAAGQRLVKSNPTTSKIHTVPNILLRNRQKGNARSSNGSIYKYVNPLPVQNLQLPSALSTKDKKKYKEHVKLWNDLNT